MLTQSTEMAIKACLFLAQASLEEPVSPRVIANQTGVSPSYMAKITGLLTRAGILRSSRGVNGGVQLARTSADISLLEIAEATQGKILGNYCDSVVPHESICSFHAAMLDLHEALVGVLGRWSLADLCRRPCLSDEFPAAGNCRMHMVLPVVVNSQDKS